MKTAISLPDALYDASMKAARKMALSRSALYSRALEEFLRRHHPPDTTDRLDSIYKTEGGRLDTAVARGQSRSVKMRKTP